MKVLKLIGDLKKYIFIMIVFSVTQVFCELYLPNIMSNIVDIGIANADKASSSQYTELTAEAKRDILNKMKTVIGTDESSKYTVVIDAKAK